ncbi:MAG TPA: ubiquinol-cytochrome c reductase iron-sulfur subunit, partial [Rhodocyclaceae bacterium]|nr:ubiquinol-cytochrome c reductase iron-sulfur subunit [Rhodocyclaceae bacterium]
MSNQGKVDCGRRRLIVATAAVGGVGGLVSLVPFVSSLLPSERAKAAGAPVEVDISKLEPGQMMTVEWRGKPVWVINRTKEMLDTLPKLADAVADPKSARPQADLVAPKEVKVETRSVKPEIAVLLGVCTHLGCSPSQKFKRGSEEGMPSDWMGGFLCPCHGSKFDFAGRV